LRVGNTKTVKQSYADTLKTEPKKKNATWPGPQHTHLLRKLEKEGKENSAGGLSAE